MEIVQNPFRNGDRQIVVPDDIPFPSSDANAPRRLLELCPKAAETPLIDAPYLSAATGISGAYLKDERTRMGLGSFKALGAAYAIAHEANEVVQDGNWADALAGRTYVTASAGNHGMSVAAGARIFGARAVVFLSETVPASFANRLEELGAEVRRAGSDYEASMAAAARFAEEGGHTLLSDSSWQGYTRLPYRLMEGYLVMGAEISDALKEAPTHVFLQAGVGGMAAAMAAWFRTVWGEVPVITVVEPVAAPALQASISAGGFSPSKGPVSNMGRLDCKEASLIALKGLARDADYFVLISDETAQAAVDFLAINGIDASPSAVAGVAAALDPEIRDRVGLGPDSRALFIISEGAA